MYWKRTQEVPDPPPLQAISLNGNYLNPRESWEQSWKLCEDGASPLRHAEERVIIYCPMRDWQFCTNTEQRIKPHPVHADVMETFLSSQKRQRPKEIAGQARPWRQVRWEQVRNGEWALALMYNDTRMGGKWKILVGLLNNVYEFLSLFFEADWLKTSLSYEQSIAHIKLVKNTKPKSTLIPLINSKLIKSWIFKKNLITPLSDFWVYILLSALCVVCPDTDPRCFKVDTNCIDVDTGLVAWSEDQKQQIKVSFFSS